MAALGGVRAMANQYSITVSDASDLVLKTCKEHGGKPSQVIDALVYFIGVQGCMNLQKLKKQLDAGDEE